MIRAKVWFRCAAVCTIRSCRFSFKPRWNRIARGERRASISSSNAISKGSGLLLRMQGWITIDPKQAVKVFERHGRLKCFDNGELVVEVEDQAQLENTLSGILAGQLRRPVHRRTDSSCDS